MFTPGPWHWDSEAFGSGLDWCLIQGPGGDPGGSILEGGFVLADDAENLANAHLIAAAPELYEALHNLVEAVRFDVNKVRRLDQAETILAKARGEV